MRVVPVPCLSDNYAYLVIDETSSTAAVVDPGEAEPVARALARERVDLVAIWATHHHTDHVGGSPDLISSHPRGLQVLAHRIDGARILGVTRFLEDGDEVELGGVRATIIHNPGHTLGAISFLVRSPQGGPAVVFTGDTLFGAGCGRVFEGTAAMMHDSLSRLAALAPETGVYFGHEYTAANLRFAAAVEPAEPAIGARARATDEARGRGVPSVPSTIGDERATNPFLRVTEPAVVEAARARGAATDLPVEIFAALRSWKNHFG